MGCSVSLHAMLTCANSMLTACYHCIRDLTLQKRLRGRQVYLQEAAVGGCNGQWMALTSKCPCSATSSTNATCFVRQVLVVTVSSAAIGPFSDVIF